MRVAIDATPAISGRTGISLYVHELANALVGQGIDIRPFAVGRMLHPTPLGPARCRVPARFVHRSWALGGPPRPERMVGPVDVVHATALLPPTSRLPVVATVQDLTPLEHPDLHPRRLVRQTAALVKHLDRAAVVLAISETTAQALVDRGVDRERIIVTHLGPPALNPPTGDPRPSSAYLLALGEQVPRKGLTTLVRAFAAADLGSMRLVHAGPPGDQTDQLVALIRTLGVEDRVDLLGFVDRSRLGHLLRNAVALCYPSVAEGFGLPVLEALVVGTPVVASDLASVREIAADAAVLVPASDDAAWTTALERIADDAGLRSVLVANGRIAASCFTWDACATATIAAYERAVAGG